MLKKKVSEKLSTSKVTRTIKEYLLMGLGMIVYSFAWLGIILPAKGVGGGASGMALLLYYLTGGETGGGLPVGVGVFLVNGVLLIIGGLIVGWNFGIKTIYSIIILSIVMGVMQPLLSAHPNILGLADDKLLSALLGGIVAAVGVSMCLAQGGSSGGTDIVAMIVNKYKNIGYGRVVLMTDACIIGCSYFISHDIATLIYGCVLTATMGFMVDMILAGNKQSSQIFIISRTPDLIAEHVVADVHRGVTMINGEGWYSKQPLKIVMVVCRKNETSVLFRVIKDCDPDAFITVGSVMGVYGRGFDALKNGNSILPQSDKEEKKSKKKDIK